MEITIRDLWIALKKSFIFILIGAALFGTLFGFYTSTAMQKVYQSSAKYMLVTQNMQANMGSDGMANLNNSLVVGGKLIVSLKEYLMTEKTMENVLRFVEERHALTPDDDEYVLENKYTAAGLLGLFTFLVPEEDTNIVFEVRCKGYSPNDSRILLDAFGSIINERASEKVLQDVFAVETTSAPRNGGLISPNMTMNVMLGAAVGAVLPYLITLVLSILDTRIKTESDVKSKFEYPILGQIPRL